MAGTLGIGNNLGQDNPIVLAVMTKEHEQHAYRDSDWSEDVYTRKSTRGCTVHSNFGCFASRYISQCCVAASSTGAEYILLSECLRSIQYYYRALQKLGEVVEPSAIHKESQSCTIWDTNDGIRNKHAEV